MKTLCNIDKRKYYISRGCEDNCHNDDYLKQNFHAKRTPMMSAKLFACNWHMQNGKKMVFVDCVVFQNEAGRLCSQAQ